MSIEQVVWINAAQEEGAAPWRRLDDPQSLREAQLREGLQDHGLLVVQCGMERAASTPAEALLFARVDDALAWWADPPLQALARPALVLVDNDADELRALAQARPMDAVCRWPIDAGVLLARLRRQREIALRLGQLGSDPLTGLANRRQFEGQLLELLHEADSSEARAVVLIDLDGLKHVNDEFGHLAGDQLLITTAKRLQAGVRSTDLVARWGGDEFVLLLQRGRQRELPDAVEALLAQLGEPLPLGEGVSVQISASAGLALLHPGATPDGLLRRADMGSYDAKQQGGGRLVHHELIGDEEAPDPESDLRRFAELTRLHSERLGRMVTEMGQRLLESARQQALLDALTGLHNRRYFNERLPRDIERAHRTGRPLALALIDLDDFGSVNKRHGWSAGDAVLRQFAAVTRSRIRLVDWAARYGGEEFAIVLPDTDPEQALAVMERVREGVAAASVESLEGHRIGISASIGVACLSPEMRDAMALVEAAGTACRAAKVAGKNRVLTAFT